MREINWQEPPKTNISVKDSSEKKDARPHSPSGSFAARFAAGNKVKQNKTKESVRAQNTQTQMYSEKFLRFSHDKREKSQANGDSQCGVIFDKKKSGFDSRQSSQQQNSGKDLINEYKNIPMKDRISSSGWKNLDLKNRKQTGDLYKKILYFNKKNDSKVFCFTSCRGKEGVSTVMANLVDYIKNQATDKKIMVIDANFQSPGLYKIFNVVPREFSFIDVCDNKIELRNALIPIGNNILFLTSSRSKKRKIENLEPDNFIQLLNECRQIVDYVLIDCPPLLISSDAIAVAPAADVSFLVIKAVEVQRAVAQKAISYLVDNECKIGGVILNYVQQVIPNWVYKFI